MTLYTCQVEAVDITATTYSSGTFPSVAECLQSVLANLQIDFGHTHPSALTIIIAQTTEMPDD